MRSMRKRQRNSKPGKIRLGRFQKKIGETFWGRRSKELDWTRRSSVLMIDRYQRAFIDFFEDQLVSNRYNLQELLDEYLLGGKEPLINGMISGRE